MFQHIALSVALSILAQFGIVNPPVTSYIGNENAGFCIQFDKYYNEVCVETEGVPGVYLCNITKSEDCGVLDLTGIDRQDNVLAKVGFAFGCNVDIQTAEPECHMPGDVIISDDGNYVHKGGQFWKAYNQRVLNLPALSK